MSWQSLLKANKKWHVRNQINQQKCTISFWQIQTVVVSSCSFLFTVNMSLFCIMSRIQCTCLDNYLLQGILKLLLHLLETKQLLWTFAVFRVFEFRNSHCHSVPVKISINHEFVYKFVNQVKFYADRFRFKTWT